jgi:hypothetical protein
MARKRPRDEEPADLEYATKAATRLLNSYPFLPAHGRTTYSDNEPLMAANVELDDPAKWRPWTREEWVEFNKHAYGPNASAGANAAAEILWLSHQFPHGSREWRILLQTAEKLDPFDDLRPAGRPKKSGPDKKLLLAVGVCLMFGHNATFVAQQLEPIYNWRKKEGPDRDHRIHYLAKKIRKALANLSPAEAEEAKAFAAKYFSDDVDIWDVISDR